MFGVREGAEIKISQDGKNPIGFIAWKNHVTTKFNVFDKCELAIDPTGIGRLACVPGDRVTIGGALAKKGWYGFRRDGFLLLVDPRDVEYDGRPVCEPTRCVPYVPA